MNTKRCILATIAVFVFVFVSDFLIHGQLLKDIYEQTAHLWRPQSEHNMAFMLASQILFSLVITVIFSRHYEAKGIGEGFRFGLLIGLLLGTIQLGTYCYMPIPLSLTLSWVAASLVKGLGSGLALALTYKN